MSTSVRHSWWQLFVDAGNGWLEHKAPKLGAALAYYAAFSIPPFLVIVLALVALLFGDEMAKASVDEQLHSLLGDEAAAGVQSMISAAAAPSRGIVATVVGLVVLLFGASGVFGELQDSLNTIWNVQPKPGQGVLGFLRGRFLSFAAVSGVGFLLLVSLLLSAALSAAGKWLGDILPIPAGAMEAANFGLSLAVITVLFAGIFKYLPDAPIRWRHVWFGAVATAALFTLGKFALGMYLGQASPASAYGAAGSLVLVLVWVYYSAQIFFFGAELTRAHAGQSDDNLRSPGKVTAPKVV